MKRPTDGVINSKLTPYEMLQHAILVQAVADIKTTTWYNVHEGVHCSYKEGAEAVQYIVVLLKQHGYSKKEIGKIFREITPHNYKYDIVKQELEKRGIKL